MTQARRSRGDITVCYRCAGSGKANIWSDKPAQCYHCRGHGRIVWRGHGESVPASPGNVIFFARGAERKVTLDIPDDWLPTAANINALPEPLRRYIHDLETRADPSGDVLLIYELRTMVRGLEAMILKDRGESPLTDEQLRILAREHRKDEA